MEISCPLVSKFKSVVKLYNFIKKQHAYASVPNEQTRNLLKYERKMTLIDTLWVYSVVHRKKNRQAVYSK